MEKIRIEKKPVALWNNSGNDFVIILHAVGLQFRLDMETAYHFAFLISTLGCGIDPTGYMYSSEQLKDIENVSFDLPRNELWIQDSIYLEKQINGGCYLEFHRFHVLTYQKTKDFLYLDADECDYIYLQIVEL